MQGRLHAMDCPPSYWTSMSARYIGRRHVRDGTWMPGDFLVERAEEGRAPTVGRTCYNLFTGNTILGYYLTFSLLTPRDLQPLKLGNLEPNRSRPCP